MNDKRHDFEENAVGRVLLVGAGPGDPRLITVRGLQCLQQADCVLYDGLVNLALLDMAPQAEKISVGKHGRTPFWQQTAINQEMIRLARNGKTVVRLKGGDPAVFARTSEELESLHANKIPFEVVPGITAALAVAAYSGIPLTHRDHSSAVALVTGQQQDQAPTEMDWPALAKFPGTLSIYMGVTTSNVWSSQLIAAGKPKDTPAAIIRRCSWPDQQVILCGLNEVSEHLTPSSKMRPPVLVVIGPVAHLGQKWNWFQQKPLFGRGIWIPRAPHQSEELNQRLTDLGACVFTDPVMRIKPPSNQADLIHILEILQENRVQGVTFSSANGVDGFFKFLLESEGDVRLLKSARLAAVGPATARQLLEYGLKADIVPEDVYSAEGLLASLGQSVFGEHWVVTKTNRSHATLAEGLRSQGATVTECLAYETVPSSTPGLHWTSALEAGQIGLALITSSAIGQMAFQLLGSRVGQVSPIAISQSVALSLQSLGWPPTAVAESSTTESLVQAVLLAAQTRSQ